jgi:PHD/YefM family antitoxin component YafN of YafNO toxin-antitoxin module
MQHYSLSEMRDRAAEILKQAAIAPILLTAEATPDYVILSAQDYQQLLDRLDALEDAMLGQLAETARNTSSLVGTEAFTTELHRFATLDPS